MSLLLLGNMVALPILSIPAYGFIYYMNLDGIWLFVLVAWVGVSALAGLVWRHIGRKRLAISCALATLSAYVPAVVAYGVALHPLLWRGDDPILWQSIWFSATVGGLFTVGYWLPASIVNCAVLRRIYHLPSRSIQC